MSFYETIEERLLQISEGEFHRICDGYLRVNFGPDVQSIGKAKGKQKTKKGKPDAYCVVNGRYIIAEYTTTSPQNLSTFEKKIWKDFTDSFNLTAHNIKIEDVYEIVVICNSDVPIKLDKKIRDYANKYQIAVRIVGITPLVTFLSREGRSLAKEVLQIPFNAGQVSSLDEFIEYYTRKNSGATLKNEFIGRNNELLDLKKSLIENDYLLVLGPPGIGKTRLVLQSLRQFSHENREYACFAINNQPESIYEHLENHLNKGNKFILFIDDADKQLAHISSALHYKGISQKFIIKIIMTVRDAAKNDIIQLLEKHQLARISIKPLNDNIIRALITNAPYNLTNENRIKEIIRYSKGNPRTAMVRAQNACTTPFNDSEEMPIEYQKFYESNYSHISHLLSQPFVIKSLGLLSYFETIDLDAPEEKVMIECFGIEFHNFFDTCQKMESYEILDFNLGNIVSFVDQELRTYIFYKTFITNPSNFFPFLIEQSFQLYGFRMRNAIESVVHNFGESSVTNNILPLIENQLTTISKNDNEYFPILSVFGKYMPMKLFSYIQYLYNKYSKEQDSDKKAISVWQLDDTIRLLEPFYESDNDFNFKAAIDLTVQRIMLIDIDRSKWQNVIISALTIGTRDLSQSCKRQEYLINKLANLNDNKTGQLLFDLNYSIIISSYLSEECYLNGPSGLILQTQVNSLRGKFWNFCIQLFNDHPKLIFQILLNYLRDIKQERKISSIQAKSDQSHLFSIIEKNLDYNNFEHSYFAISYLLIYEANSPLLIRFKTSKFQLFQALTLFNETTQPDQMIDLYDHDKVIDYRTNKIRSYFVTQFGKSFIENYQTLEEIASSNTIDSIFSSGVSIYLSLSFSESIEDGIRALDHIFLMKNSIQLYPGRLQKTLSTLNSRESRKIYNCISKYEYINKNEWLNQFFISLPPEDVNKYYLREFYKFLSDISTSPNLFYLELKKFEVADKAIFTNVLMLLLEKRKGNKKFIYYLDQTFLIEVSKDSNCSFKLLEECYYQCVEMDNSFDFENKTLFLLLGINPNFLLQYYKTNFSNVENRNLRQLWNYENCFEIITNILDYLIEAPFQIHGHKGFPFFPIDEKTEIKRVEFLKVFLSSRNLNLKAVNLILDIIRNRFSNEAFVEMIVFLLRQNGSLDIFKKIVWHNNHFSTNSRFEIWDEVKSKFLKGIRDKLKSLPDYFNFLEHIEVLENLIKMHDRIAYAEKKSQYRLYTFKYPRELLR